MLLSITKDHHRNMRLGTNSRTRAPRFPYLQDGPPHLWNESDKK